MEKHEASAARGWYLIYQDKLKESQDYFDACLREGPSIPVLEPAWGRPIISGVGRGRPWSNSKSAEMSTPKMCPARVGEATALNDLNYKYEARRLAAELYRKYPYDLHVQDLYENLKVEDMHRVWGMRGLSMNGPGPRNIASGVGSAPASTRYSRSFLRS